MFPASRGFLAWLFSGRCRPSDKGGGGGGGHTDPEISGGAVSIKFFWSENKGGPGTTGPCPGSAISFSIHEVKKANCVKDK